jgi:hypothetical protein
MKNYTVLIISMVALLYGGVGLACGDSLYRVGKGVAYRVYTAPLPGSVLVYGEGKGAEQLARELARSGHGVRLVGNNTELRSEIGSGAYDVVIAAYTNHSDVESVTTSVVNAPAFLPVAVGVGEETQARASYQRVMVAEKDEIKHYLKAIHKTLKQATSLRS